jgi:tetratricopeptide (TPR) repeat protein
VEEGFKLIERAHKLAPSDPFILDSMGWALFRLGRLDEAEKYLARAFFERPDPEIAAHLGEVLFAKGQPQKAREIWQSQLKATPDHPLLLETVRRHSR